MGLLRELGYERVRYYHGGLEDWRANGGPVVGAASRDSTEPRSEDGESEAAGASGDTTRARRGPTWVLYALDRFSTR